MANDPNALTNMWMLDPTMFDPTQKSNQFSSFNNAPMPFPPTYNEGNMGGPVNAATGQLIPSYQQWKQQNPSGTTINNTPAQPQQQGNIAFPQGVYSSNYMSSLSPATQQALQARQPVPLSQMLGGNTYGNQPQNDAAGIALLMGLDPSRLNGFSGGQTAAAPAAQAAPSSGGGAPNNWYAALNALAAPGNPVTQGATVPMAQGFQPAGGVNQAFLGQAGAGNRNFLSALAAIQGRPQGVA